MHEPLAEPLLLREPRLTGGHFRKVRVHARVPAPIAQHAASAVEIADVVALARRADKGARPAAQTRLRQRRPCRIVEERSRFSAAKALRREGRKRELRQPLADHRLAFVHGFCIVFVRVLRERFDLLEERFSFCRFRVPVEQVVRAVADHVALRIRRVDAKRAAEAGFHRPVARQRNNHPMAAAVLVVRVHRIGKEHVVQYRQRAHVAGADPEQDEILRLAPRVEDLDLLLRHSERHQVLRLREEQLLRVLLHHRSAGEHCVLRPGCEPRHRTVALRNIHGAVPAYGGEDLR